METLREEVKRLREALQHIAGMPPHGYGSEMAFAMATIAVMALAERNEDDSDRNRTRLVDFARPWRYDVGSPLQSRSSRSSNTYTVDKDDAVVNAAGYFTVSAIRRCKNNPAFACFAVASSPVIS